jgi:hypothetical protein
MKNSEAAKLNNVKRELTITLRVLEGEFETLSEIVDPETTKVNENTMSDLYLRNSIKDVMLYLKDLRNDFSNEIDQKYLDYIEGQRNLSDWVYEHYNNDQLYSLVHDEALELIGDQLDYDGFTNINFDHFEFIQGLLHTLKHKGILWEDQIDYLAQMQFIEFPKEDE